VSAHIKLLLVAAVGCFSLPAAVGRLGAQRAPEPERLTIEKVKPGITVLLDKRIGLIQHRRIALVTNQAGQDEKGRSDIDLLREDPRATKVRVQLVALFAPEHGIRGTEDHSNVPNEVDAKSGLTVHSLFGAQTIGPPDSLLVGVETIIVDLPDIGTRTWTFTGVMLYTLRAAARHHIPVLVLDRPNPITGTRVEGPLLDSALANPNDPEPGTPGKAYALYPVPLRHGMTMGEMALYFNDRLKLGADLTVVPMEGWKRSTWFDETGLKWVRPSPNLPTLTSALIYPALVAFEGTNVSVGRGTSDAFQHIGAPWLKAREIIDLLQDRQLPGVKFESEHFTPNAPTDGKYGGQSIPAVKIVITDRDRVSAARVGAALLWAIVQTSRDSLKIRDLTFDERFGAARVREAILRGDDPDTVLDRELPAMIAFRESIKPYLLYR
jgi:uncharacterized protein YbbC (DUF1343 family)